MRIGFFGVLLVLLFGAAFALGAALDPDTEKVAEHGDAEGHAGAGDPSAIELTGKTFEPGVERTLAFRVVDRDGRAVEDFDVEHERRMHVILARHDLTGYQHVHPRRTADGWEMTVAFDEPGAHRVFADFSSGGESHTLAADVEVTGDYRPRELPAPSLAAEAGDGYAVALVRRDGERSFTVSRNGREVEDVEPYLGARGHLVVLREHDLEFLHVHPQDAATAGRSIRFAVRFPSAGRYRMFLQFKHDGRVHTAAFTEHAGGPDAGASEHGSDHGH